MGKQDFYKSIFRSQLSPKKVVDPPTKKADEPPTLKKFVILND
jgi:hypothetical protein